MAIVGWFCDYGCGFLDDTNTVEEELIPSFGVLLPLPDSFEACWFRHVCFRFITWEEPPFPTSSIQVEGTVHLVPCPIHLYLVMINKNKTLFVTVHIFYTGTTVSLIFQYTTFSCTYLITVQPKELTYISLTNSVVFFTNEWTVLTHGFIITLSFISVLQHTLNIICLKKHFNVSFVLSSANIKFNHPIL